MTDPTEVARLVDGSLELVPGIAHVYVAAPAVSQIAEAGRREVRSHVTPLPKSVRVAIGVHHTADVRDVTRSAATAVRRSLPEDWAEARVTVQVRRVERERG